MAENGWIWLYIHRNEDLTSWKDARIYLEQMIKIWDRVESKVKLNSHTELKAKEIAVSMRSFDSVVQKLLSLFKSFYSQY